MAANTMFDQLEEKPPEVQKGVRTWLRKQSMMLVFVALLLFWPAGTLGWMWGWVQVALYVVVVAAQALILIPRSPELIAERANVQAGTRKWDIVIAGLAASLLPMTAWIIAGLDVRFGWPPDFAAWLQIVAGVAWLLGYAFTIWAMAANAYFSATVRIQEERDHRVVKAGPYRWVRHPGYVGAIIFTVATPILLGSLWAMVPSAIAGVLYVVRTALEDRTLREELPGYEEYAHETRWRLLPGVW